MKLKISHLPLLVIFSLLLSACSLPFSSQKAGVQITSTPQATVTVDGESFGQTPIIRGDLKTGTHSVKITASEPGVLPWEGQVVFNPGVTTIIDRQLSADSLQSTGYILTLEKLSDKKSTEVQVITTQDNVSVAIDGSPAGFTPLKNESLTAGPHVFFLSSPGFQDKTVKANVQAGFRLTINVQLASQTIIDPLLDLSPSPTATPSSVTATPTLSKTTSEAADDITPLPKQASGSAIAKPYVEISSTPTGFLRVRNSASASATEIAKVSPGDKFPYLETQDGWYQIEYQENETGWVSATYAKLVE